MKFAKECPPRNEDSRPDFLLRIPSPGRAGRHARTVPRIRRGGGIAAHRDRYFRPLKDIVVGDILELESLSGHGEFRVSRIAIVDPDDVSALDDTTSPTLTLVTCHPFYFIGNAPQRYIVQATAVEQSGNIFITDAVPAARKSGDTP